MRKLSIKQKKVIDTVVGQGFYCMSQVPNIMSKLEQINDYETLWSDAERYLNDKESELKYGKRGL